MPQVDALRRVRVESRAWPFVEPFAISRGVILQMDTIQVFLEGENGVTGRGEACGVDYAGETPEAMIAQIHAIKPALEAGAGREDLLDLLPSGGARCAVDGALWDLEAKASGSSAFSLAGVGSPKAVETAYTIGIRPIPEYRSAAAARSEFRVLKIKVDAREPLAALEAARLGAPNSVFIVDPNQAWTIDDLKALAPRMVDMGVVLLEQPIRVGDEAGLDGYRSPIPLCADELINTTDDLDRAKGRFDVVNIKLDKSGGLTAGLQLAAAAKCTGFELMVGCMGGSSLSIAPATVLAQQCKFVDLDGPLLQAEDWPDSLQYHDGYIEPPSPRLWG